MTSPDDLIKNLEVIYSSFGEFCKRRGAASESDTRHKVIDRIIHDVLQWPHEFVKCEDRTDIGIIDYTLFSAVKNLLVIEAKRSGQSWSIPHSNLHRRSYRLTGVINKNKDLNAAIDQVQAYCNAQGIRYAIASNGYSFVVFRAITESYAWRTGEVMIFHSAKDVLDNFNDFWELLAYENIIKGSLDNYFQPKVSHTRIYDKPIAHISNEDALYGRNIISSLLQPYIEKFFGDIAVQSSKDIFESCYVYSPTLRKMDKNLQITIKDEIPKYAKKNGFQELFLANKGDILAQRLRESSKEEIIGDVIILMGGIGCGKSTYLRYLTKQFAQTDKENSLFLYLDYLGYSSELHALSEFTYDSCAEILKKQKGIVEREVLELIFQDEIDELKQTKFYSIKEDKLKLEEKIGDFLYERIKDKKSFSEKTISALLRAKILPVLIFDNVDQLPLNIQIEIFTTAQHFSRQIGCLSILALREESYCTARMQKVFTAYSRHKFHISSPRFSKMIEIRIEKSLEAISNEKIPTIFVSNQKVSKDELLNFLRVVHDNLFRPYRPTINLIESISYGDMRYSLHLLNTFMTSGTTDVGKILIHHMKSGGYTVAFHEFVKSVTLSEYKYYKENRSFIINLYDIQKERNSSHFTGIRLLRYLAKHRNDPSPEGSGFIEINILLNLFEDLFQNENDVIKTILKFIGLNRQLIELDTRMSDSLEGSSYVRITPAGQFYQKILYKEFPYLDLVWQDTPINDTSLSLNISKMIHKTEMEERFKRVEMFLDYLDGEEKAELDLYGISAVQNPITDRIVPQIKKSFESTREYIRRKREIKKI